MGQQTSGGNTQTCRQGVAPTSYRCSYPSSLPVPRHQPMQALDREELSTTLHGFMAILTFRGSSCWGLIGRSLTVCLPWVVSWRRRVVAGQASRVHIALRLLL